MRTRRSNRTFFSILAATLATAGAGAMAADPAPRPPAQNEAPLVWCYDTARSLVSRKRASECTGRVVDDAEAKRLGADRIRRIEQKFHPAAPLFPGRRLSGSGTGFFVSAAGDALTNFHVVDGCAGLSVTPPGERPAAASVLATDRPHDLALLHVPFAPKAVAVFRDPPQPVAEEPVMVVGYPLLQLVAIKPVSVSGHVYRSVHTSLTGRFPISIDIRHGNSGSPVLDGGGRVIGIVSAKVDTPKVYAATGRVVRDLGVAIGAPAILDLMRGSRVAPTTAAPGAPLDDKTLFTRGRALVAQIACWR